MSILIKKMSPYSWFKIKTKNRVINIDPGYAGYFKTHGIPVIEFEEKSDIILVTHFHKDHCQSEAISKTRNKDTIVICPQNSAERIGGKISIVKPEQCLNISDIIINTVYAYNTTQSNSTHKLHHKGECIGYLINIGGIKIYHAGDTDLIPEMNNIKNVDLALLPIGGTYTMDINEAIQSAVVINPKVIIPMHFLKADPEEFKVKLEAKSNIKVIILKTGETYQLE